MDTGSIMKYKNYSALIRYSEEDDCLVGRVLGISDIISFEGDSVVKVRQEFKAALDDYLEICKEEGKEPERPYSGKIIVRMPSDLHRRVAIGAEAQAMSINDAIVRAIESVYGAPGKKSASPAVARPPRQRKAKAPAV